MDEWLESAYEDANGGNVDLLDDLDIWEDDDEEYDRDTYDEFYDSDIYDEEDFSSIY
jgi:hypothetical protein